MADASLDWGGDLAASATGDILLATGGVGSDQRVIRRFLTNPGSYIWQPSYGAGLGQFIGDAQPALTIEAVLKKQVALEPSIAASPSPTVSVIPQGSNALGISVNYAYVQGGASQVVSLVIGG